MISYICQMNVIVCGIIILHHPQTTHLSVACMLTSSTHPVRLCAGWDGWMHLGVLLRQSVRRLLGHLSPRVYVSLRGLQVAVACEG